MATLLSPEHFPVMFDATFLEKAAIEYEAWKSQAMSRRNLDRLEVFVGKALEKRGRAKFNGMIEGTHNVNFRFCFPENKDYAKRDVILRVSKPGNLSVQLAAEKLEDEAHWLQYMGTHNVLPVPQVYKWSVTGTIGPCIGPYILMDFVPGQNLLTYITELLSSSDTKAQQKLDRVFEQIARMQLKLYRHRFDRIGSIEKTTCTSSIFSDGMNGRRNTSVWEVTRRPLTEDMHLFIRGIPRIPSGLWPMAPLHSDYAFLTFVVGMQRQQIIFHCNINIPLCTGEAGKQKQQTGKSIDLELSMAIANGRYRARRSISMHVAGLTKYAGAEEGMAALTIAVEKVLGARGWSGSSCRGNLADPFTSALKNLGMGSSGDSSGGSGSDSLSGPNLAALGMKDASVKKDYFYNGRYQNADLRKDGWHHRGTTQKKDYYYNGQLQNTEFVGQFSPFNATLRYDSMVVDPETAEITGIIDLGFTNAMPLIYAHDPPLWLNPDVAGKAIEQGQWDSWRSQYEPLLEKFLTILRRVEAAEGQGGEKKPEEKRSAGHVADGVSGQMPDQAPLSTLMQASWDSRQCWIHYALNNSIYADAVYHAMPEVFPDVSLDETLGVASAVYGALSLSQIRWYDSQR